MLLSPQQCKAARALLDWSQGDLARKSRVSPSTLANFEAGKRIPYDRTLADIVEAFTSEGIEFVSNPPKLGVIRVMPPSLFDNLE